MPRPKKYTVSLTDMEIDQFTRLTKNYRYSKRERTRAQILLLSHQGQGDTAIAEQVGCHAMTVHNVRERYCLRNQGDESPLPAPSQVKRARQVNRRARAFDGEKEAQLVAIVCGVPPDGAKQWTLELLHEKVISMKIVDSVAKETIRAGFSRRKYRRR